MASASGLRCSMVRARARNPWRQGVAGLASGRFRYPPPPPPPSSSSSPTKGELEWDSGLILRPAPPSSKWWDRGAFGGPVVTRDPFYQVRYSPYRVYYHGRHLKHEWNLGVPVYDPSLSTGRIGLAMSEEGIVVERFKGPLDGGAIMDPSPDPDTFDCVHLEVTDVFFRAHDARWYMYYAGAGMDEKPLVGSPDRNCKAVRSQVGLVKSKDGINIKEEHRVGLILSAGEPGDWDENGICCPRVLPPWEHGFPPGPLKGKWIMSYHTKENGGPNGAGVYSAGVAYSDDGVEFEKKGKLLGPGPSGSWDEAGISSRYIIRLFDDYLLFYEGRNYKNETAIGLAVSKDGIEWEKDEKCGDEPGGPILKPRKGNFWDNLSIGDPYAIPMFDGSLRIYYSATGIKEGETEPQTGFGLALCERLNYRNWRRYTQDNPGPKEHKRGFQPPKLPKW